MGSSPATTGACSSCCLWEHWQAGWGHHPSYIFIFLSFFLQYFTHPPFSKTPALAVIHAPSFISIFSGCSSGLWQISISIVRPGKEPNGPYRHFLCSWSPLSLCTGRGGGFFPLFFWFLSALCVFVCVSWWSFFTPCGNSEVSVTSLWSLLTAGSLQMLKGIVHPKNESSVMI